MSGDYVTKEMAHSANVLEEYIRQLEKTTKSMSEEITHKQDDYCMHYCNTMIEHKYLSEDRQKLIEYIEKKRDKLNDEEKEIYKKDIGNNELYRLKIIDEARNVLQEILELVKGEMHEKRILKKNIDSRNRKRT